MSEPTGLTLSVYTNNSAMVHYQSPQLPIKGATTLELTEMSPKLVRESAVAVYRFDNGTKGPAPALVADTQQYTARWVTDKMIGKEVTVTSKKGQIIKGKLIHDAGWVVLETKEPGPDNKTSVTLVNEVDFISCTEVSIPKSAGQLAKPRILVAEPTPEDIKGKATSYHVQVAHLTGGLTWTAFYQLVLAPDYSVYFFKAQALVLNRSGTTYKDSHLKLVTGSGPEEIDLMRNRREDNEEAEVNIQYRSRESKIAASAPRSSQFQTAAASQSTGERYEYLILEETTLNNGEEHEVILFTKKGKLDDFERFFDFDISEFEYGADLRGVQHGVQFKSPKFLTEGKVQVYREKDDNMLGIFEGCTHLPQTIKGDLVCLTLGTSMNVKAGYKCTLQRDTHSSTVKLIMSFLNSPDETYKDDQNFKVSVRFPLNGRSLRDFKRDEHELLDEKTKLARNGKPYVDLKQVEEVRDSVRLDVGPLPKGVLVFVSVSFDLKSQDIGY